MPRPISCCGGLPESPQHPGQLLLHVTDGRLREVEILDYGGEKPQATFPPVSTWERPSVESPMTWSDADLNTD